MFERFTTEARSTVMQAQEQARGLGHNYIGTEHILLALLAAEDGTAAGRTLRALGESYEGARAEVLAIVGPGEGAAPGHIPFTPRSKKVLELSLREALKLKQKSIRPEHIVLGLVREGEGLALQVLTKHGIDLRRLRQDVVAALSAEPGPARMYRVPDPRMSAMTPGGARAADRAVDLAAGSPVASQHYLLGVLDDKDSLAAKALAELGVSREAVEAKLAELGPLGTSDEPPDQAAARRTRLKVEGDTVLVSFEEPELAGKLRSLLAGHIRNVPGVEAVWRATLPAIWNVARQLERTGPQEWSPPGWSTGGAAAFAVMSRPEGPSTRLWTAAGVDDGTVRTWLTDWLPTLAPPAAPSPTSPAAPTAPTAPAGMAPAAGYVYLTVSLDRDDATGNLSVAGFASGSRPAPPEWPAVPLGDLLAAAVAELTPPG